MRNTPTDLEILDHIYETYYQDYMNFLPEKPNRVARILVPLDLQKIATHFNIDINILFGRFYYDMNHKYNYKDSGGVPVKLFQSEVRGSLPHHTEKNKTVPHKDVDCIQFLYLASILADLRDENRKYNRANLISWISATAAIISLVISIVALAK